jgi:hypothetical protein
MVFSGGKPPDPLGRLRRVLGENDLLLPAKQNYTFYLFLFTGKEE